jgi:hypothetical protein
MKNIQNLFSAAVCGLVLAFTGAASAQDIIQGIATIVRVRGEASYTLQSGANPKWIPLVAGKILTAGTTIKTEPDAMVDIVLGKSVDFPQATTVPRSVTPAADSPVRGMVSYKPAVEQNVIRLSGDTTLKIDTLTVSETGVDTVSDTELDLQNGRIFYSVKKLSADSKYLIKFPNGIAGVRGSQGFMSVVNGKLGACGALVHPLWITVTSPGMPPVTVEVEQGDQYDPGSGQSSPLSPELLNLLQQIATAAGSSYYEIVSYSPDRVTIFVSPTTGAKGNGSGNAGNQGNQGGDGGVVILEPVAVAAH